MKTRKIILDFVYKFFYILKAASDGWIIHYIGGNEFEFSGPKKFVKDCLKSYKNIFPNFLTDKS